MKTLLHENTFINIGEKGHFFLSGRESELSDYKYGYINTNLAVMANYEAEYEGLNIMPTDDFFRFENISLRKGGADISYKLTTYNIGVDEKVDGIDGADVFRQTVKVTNNEPRKIRLSRLSCANVTGIGIEGGKWYSNDRFCVYFCYNHWQGEGQWQKKSLRELGIYPASRHVWEKATFRLQSVGSWSTSDYYPLLIIEDSEKGECWFFEREGAENWFIEINAFEGFGSPFINVSIGEGDEACGWYIDLAPGEEYITSAAVYGVVKGDFENAVKELLKYKRKRTLVEPIKKIVFNDFMNCNWANPSAEKLLPLIDKASEAGAEVFCIDAGWATNGTWEVCEEKLKPYGLKGLVDYINAKGMIAGLWFEFETGDLNQADHENEDYFLKRDGALIAHHRPKVNLRYEKARQWLLFRIDEVYKLGVRYIKNDHNNDERWGTNYPGESPAVGVKRKTQAFYGFIDELHRRYPDLIIENCAAGAMREDGETLRRFHLQSFSDQEDYRLNPSILIGQSACIPPEKEGIWAYPYPLTYHYIDSSRIPQEEIKSYSDGRQTAFNMVSGMMGVPYLSGRIDLADENNTELIKEALNVYKQYRKSLSCRYPAYPLPMKSLNDNSYNAYGLISENGDDMILAVWALEQTDFKIDLSKYGYVNIRKIYPSRSGDKFEYSGFVLWVRSEKKYSAGLYVLNKNAEIPLL